MPGATSRAILAQLSDDVDWEGVIGAGPHVPQSGRRKGKDEVRAFFHAVRDTTDWEVFEPQEFIAQGDRVVVLGHYAAVTKATGLRVASDWVMVFRLRDGLTTEFREFSDSAAINAAYEAPKAAASGR